MTQQHELQAAQAAQAQEAAAQRHTLAMRRVEEQASAVFEAARRAGTGPRFVYA